MADLVGFKVVVDATTVARSTRGQVTGVVFIQLGSQEFPEPGWNDFPVVVLNWWLRELRSCLGTEGRPARCLFMDGPFGFEVIPGPADQCAVRLVSNDGRQVFGEAAAAGPEIMTAVTYAALEVLEVCSQQAWSCNDILALREAVAKAT